METDAEFLLIETMRALPTGEVYLLERHLQRLQTSARHFDFGCDASRIRREILAAAERGPGEACMRLTLAMDGAFRIERRKLPDERLRAVTLSAVRVDSTDNFLRYKTTRRELYERARRACAAGTDALLVNERGEITETTIMNVAVLRDGHWITPATSCGLLPGVMRAELLDRGEIVEGVVEARSLQHGEMVRCFNALRGVVDASLDCVGV